MVPPIRKPTWTARSHALACAGVDVRHPQLAQGTHATEDCAGLLGKLLFVDNKG